MDCASSPVFLWDEGLVQQKPFTVETLGGVVTCQVGANGKIVTVEMGKVSFNGSKISGLGWCAGDPAQVHENR